MRVISRCFLTDRLPDESTKMIRVFIAVELSSDIRKKLSALQAQLKKTLPPMNWVRPESIHLTLKFLGWVDSSRVSQLLSALEPIGDKQSKFSMEVQQLGVFPSIKRPRILWVGVTGQTHIIQQLVLEIEATLESLGFPPEEKPYHPHLTIARIKRDNALVGAALIENKVLEAEQSIGLMTVDKFFLFQSDIDAFGATYTPLGTIQLSDSSPEA